jgi:peptidoglycan/LPS O-acetylase OafA/YrhL
MPPATSRPSNAPTGEGRHAYATLDALRGVAAMVVVLYHFAGNLVAPHGYLAVDLFFAMSGFVVASAYERRLGGDLDLKGFLRIRLQRLAPLWILGVVLGLALMLILPGDAHHLLLLGALSLLLIPQSLTFLGAFALNTSLWSLHVELVVNTLYAALVRALIAVAGLQGALSDGASQLDLPGGYLRALFAFPMGVVLWRRRDRLPAWRAGPVLVIVGAALLLTGIGAPTHGWIGVAYDLAFVALGVPMLVILAVRSEPAPRLRPLFGFLGAISYALYALHEPIVQALRRFAAGHGGVPQYLEIGALVVPGLVLLAWAADRVVDTPVRAWLGAWRRRPTAGQEHFQLPGH